MVYYLRAIGFSLTKESDKPAWYMLLHCYLDNDDAGRWVVDSLHELLADEAQNMFAPYPFYKDLNFLLALQEENSIEVVIYRYYFSFLDLNSNTLLSMSDAPTRKETMNISGLFTLLLIGKVNCEVVFRGSLRYDAAYLHY